MQPNMKKEYRAELKSVRKQLGQLTRCTRAARTERDRRLRNTWRDFDKLLRRHERVGKRLITRQQILEGRLS
jgi:hypothetical protein